MKLGIMRKRIIKNKLIIDNEFLEKLKFLLFGLKVYGFLKK
ncbi:hypothetical protein BSPA14S_PA0101 (plasmid) [Borreliella spielmanii A14S]|uniref:Uncharacterized protein n=1 Tax=Borreliella spielmanii A14S TaxID=498742 RepID=B9X9H9_9SPIR|nr:hypothetical protein BSPA14S_PA0101 [Borreliella spielmanii A14S]